MDSASALAETVARLRAVVMPVQTIADGQEQRLVDRAAGLLAGRIGCRLEQAYGHLSRLAHEQDRELIDVARAALDALETAADPAQFASPAGSTPAASSSAGGSGLMRPAPPVRGADRLARDLLDRLAGPTGAAAVMLMVVEPDGSLQIVGSAGMPARVVSAWQRLPPHVETAARAAATSVRELWLPDLADARKRYVLIGDPHDDWPSRAWLPVHDGEWMAGLVGVLWARPEPFDPQVRQVVRREAAAAGRRLCELLVAADAELVPSRWLTSVQAVLDMLPASVAVLAPVRDPDGAVVDYVVAAASAEAVDVTGRRGAEMVGLRILECYPTIAEGDLWTAYEQVLATGRAVMVGPFTHTETVEGVPATTIYSVRANRLASGLLITWVRHDDQQRQADLVARMERLGNLGWFEWDLRTGHAVWSDQLYRIFESDPAHGPLSLDEVQAIILPEDLATQANGLAGLLDRGESADYVYRLRIGGKVKHVRVMAEAVRDVAGRPLKVYGVTQDVTAQVRLASVERQLAERQRRLDAEHRLTVDLQQIILPVPEAPVDLPGLRVAVRYLPAENSTRVGGDWYHAAALPCGRTLLAVGDVAGHGIPAAATMAQLRHALGALAVTTVEPADLLAHLNRLLYDSGRETTATAVVARYDADDGALVWAQAGHPAPLMHRRGVTVPLERPPGPLLGAIHEPTYQQARVPFRPGDVLVLYTDGLIERPGQSVDDGLRLLSQTLDDAIATGDPPLAALLSRLDRANPNDDTCVVAARPIPVSRR